MGRVAPRPHATGELSFRGLTFPTGAPAHLAVVLHPVASACVGVSRNGAGVCAGSLSVLLPRFFAGAAILWRWESVGGMVVKVVGLGRCRAPRREEGGIGGIGVGLFGKESDGTF